MDRQLKISRLKQTLAKDVKALIQRPDVQWRSVIVDMARELRESSVSAVIFGGTLRSLLLGRLSERPRFGRPRDLDIVVAGSDVAAFQERVGRYIVRQTRFGGLKLQRGDWQFDVWPVARTWAIENDDRLQPSFKDLPKTTFFNLEAIAIDLWAEPGRQRTIYSGDDRFFEGILDRTIEINREENPFPTLCVVRSLLLARSTGFSLGPRLARYLTLQRDSLSIADMESVQVHHYGSRRMRGTELMCLLDHVARKSESEPNSPIKLPQTQLWLWDEDFLPSIVCD